MMIICKKLFFLLALLGVTWGKADTIALKPNQDNTLYQDAGGTLSNGAGDYLFAGNTDNGVLRRALLQFNLSGIPSGSIITNVALQLFMDRSIAGDQEMSLHGVLADWGEGDSDASAPGGAGAASSPNDATWIHRFYSDISWTAPGGDYAAIPTASQVVGGNGFYTWSSVGMVRDAQGWLDASAGNFGWILIGKEDALTTAKRFHSSEHPTTANQPLLTVSYSVPEPSPGWLLSFGFLVVLLIRRRRLA